MKTKALEIIQLLKSSGQPPRSIPTIDELQSKDSLELNLQYLRLKATKCPICKTQPIVVGGYSGIKRNIYFQIACCGFKTELVPFERILEQWNDLKRK